MKTNFDIWKWLAPVVLLLAPACGHDQLIDQIDDQEKEKTPYVELRIAMPAERSASTRAYPTGGEEGDGRERGLSNEDLIHDVNVFFYIEAEDESGTGLGMDSPDNTEIKKHIYYNLDDSSDPNNTVLTSADHKDSDKEDDKELYKPFFEKNYLIIRFSCSVEELKQMESSGLNFVTIANVGPLQDKTTLGALRNYDLSNDKSGTWSTKYDAFSKDASKMDYFLMSTAYNANYNGSGENKISKSGAAYTGYSTLQRMYARLDLWYNESDNAVKIGEGDNVKVNELKYEVIDALGNTVFLTNALPVNLKKIPSFIFKKVTNDPSRHWSESNSLVWNYSGLNAVDQFCWGGLESISGSDTDLPDNYVVERHTLVKRPEGSGDLEGWFGKTRTSVVKEDIMKDLSNADSSVDNGKLSSYYHGMPNSTTDVGAGCDHISILGYANENTHPTDCYHSNYLTGMAFRAIYVPEKIFKGYSNGELVEMTSEERKNFNTSDQYIYRYSPSRTDMKESDALYFSDITALRAYRNANQGESAEETIYVALHNSDGGELGFVCYYNLWLRHYNDESADPSENYPMEYATVRNNIYRVKVSFTGPGDPTPTMREPDTMKARIFVRKWNFREEDTFYFD